MYVDGQRCVYVFACSISLISVQSYTFICTEVKTNERIVHAPSSQFVAQLLALEAWASEPGGLGRGEGLSKAQSNKGGLAPPLFLSGNVTVPKFTLKD